MPISDDGDQGDRSRGEREPAPVADDRHVVGAGTREPSVEMLSAMPANARLPTNVNRWRQRLNTIERQTSTMATADVSPADTDPVDRVMMSVSQSVRTPRTGAGRGVDPIGDAAGRGGVVDHDDPGTSTRSRRQPARAGRPDAPRKRRRRARGRRRRRRRRTRARGRSTVVSSAPRRRPGARPSWHRLPAEPRTRPPPLVRRAATCALSALRAVGRRGGAETASTDRTSRAPKRRRTSVAHERGDVLGRLQPPVVDQLDEIVRSRWPDRS